MRVLGLYGTWLIIGMLGLLLVSPLPADNPPPAAGWKFETLHLKSGVTFRGLVVEVSPELVRFQNVRQAPGRPTVIIPTTFPRHEVVRIDRLSDADREKLQARIRELEQISEQSEQERLGWLDLEVIPWGKDP